MRTLLATAIFVFMSLPAVAIAGGGGGCDRTITDSEGATVIMRESCFGPEVLEVERGTTVTFVNEDFYPHTVTAAGFSWGSTEQLNQNDTLTATFPRPGVYAYACILHPGMAGAIVVTGDDDTAADAPLASATPSGTDRAGAPVSAIAGVLVGVGLAVGWRSLRRRPMRPAPTT